jgi:hypothetical protein
MITNSRKLVFTLALAAMLLALPASAFVRISRQGTSGVVQAHWLDSTHPVKAVVDATNADISIATALATVQASAETWENVDTSYFTVDPIDYFANTGSTVQPVLAIDGQNSVFFDGTGANFPSAGVIAFVRSIVDTDTGETIDADLVFNDFAYFTGPAPAPAGQSLIDLQSVVTHEFGHFFGLDHTSVGQSTMIPFIIAGTAQRSLELDDRAGLSTIYPESVARGLSPGGVDFRATTGRIAGTVVSGYTGAAIFGAHVEAINIAAPTTANTISAISGELTLRNGQGEFEIHGLPPGNYAVRIVPLDGVQTVAADGNIGGVFNGIDTNFEIEFWNGAGESGIGFSDPVNDFEPVAVAAAGTSAGIGFITNAYPGRIAVVPHGSFENTVTFASNAYLAVRFDLPFETPYQITSVEFPSFTFNGVPAVFPSVSLCRIDPATGLPNLAAPLFHQVNFNGSANGLNTVPINLTVTNPGEVFFWVVRFPSQAIPGFPNNFPFMRMDFALHERGLFGASYNLNATGTAGGILVDRNLAVSMTCQMSSPEKSPIQPPASLGANRRVENTEFPYAAPAGLRADGFPLPPNFHDSTNLLRRTLAAPLYGVFATTGSGNPIFRITPAPSSTSLAIWSAQAVDKAGLRSLLSPVTITGTIGTTVEDADEPNGHRNEAKPLTLPVSARAESYSPAGDQDWFSFTAKTGDVVTASATAAVDASNGLDLVMLLLDGSGNLVAFNDDASGSTLNPTISYTVPAPSPNSNKPTQKFTILVTDFYGSPFLPTGVARVVTPAGYTLSVSTAPPPPPAP